jgi:hypothetical protein
VGESTEGHGGVDFVLHHVDLLSLQRSWSLRARQAREEGPEIAAVWRSGDGTSGTIAASVSREH